MNETDEGGGCSVASTYAYDGENRLISATSGGVTTTLSYDPLGRLWRMVKGASDTRFVHDGDALALEYNAAGAITNRYLHGSNAAADDPLMMYAGAAVGTSTRRWFHSDHLGSIVAITDGAGSNPTINRYDEYGAPAATNLGRFQYTGQVWINELKLYYYKARFYSPGLGRFMQTDPVGYEGGINLYGYVEGDPINKKDPAGLTCETVQKTGGGTTQSCHIDKVAVVKDGRVVGTRAPTQAENRRFAAFNARYTAAVNKLLSSPNKTATVAAIKDGQGSFKTTGANAAASLIAREFVFAGRGPENVEMATGGGPGIGKDATTLVFDEGLSAGLTHIVHEGGLHGTPDEMTGGLQRPGYPLGRYEHQQQYNYAACSLLGSSCD